MPRPCSYQQTFITTLFHHLTYPHQGIDLEIVARINLLNVVILEQIAF